MNDTIEADPIGKQRYKFRMINKQTTEDAP